MISNLEHFNYFWCLSSYLKIKHIVSSGALMCFSKCSCGLFNFAILMLSWSSQFLYSLDTFSWSLMELLGFSNISKVCKNSYNTQQSNVEKFSDCSIRDILIYGF